MNGHENMYYKSKLSDKAGLVDSLTKTYIKDHVQSYLQHYP